jgi:hypothetical protein
MKHVKKFNENVSLINDISQFDKVYSVNEKHYGEWEYDDAKPAPENEYFYMGVVGKDYYIFHDIWADGSIEDANGPLDTQSIFEEMIKIGVIKDVTDSGGVFSGNKEYYDKHPEKREEIRSKLGFK